MSSFIRSEHRLLERRIHILDHSWRIRIVTDTVFYAFVAGDIVEHRQLSGLTCEQLKFKIVGPLFPSTALSGRSASRLSINT
jgi:hypothetical protein